MEACPLRKSQLKSLDFAVNNALRKIFDTKSQNIVKRMPRNIQLLIHRVDNCQPQVEICGGNYCVKK